LTGLDYAVFMNSLKIAEGRYSKPIRLPASGSITIDLPLVIAASTADAIGDKLETYGQDSVMYTFMNTIHTGLPVAGKKKFQVKMQEFLPVILPVMKPPHSDIKK
jgi:LEA14-like dessication related protein